MTDVTAGGTRAGDRLRSMPAACAAAAGWTAAIGVALALTVVLVAWAADPRSGASVAETARFALLIWLTAHHVVLSVPDGTLGIAPLGLTAIPLALLARAGRVVARDTGVATPTDAALAAGAVAAPYALLVTVGCALGATADVHPSTASGLVGGAVVGLVGSGIGIVREARLGRSLVGWLPEGVHRALRAAALVGAGVLGVAVLLTAGAVVWHVGRIADLHGSLHAGLIGGTALSLLGLALLPNAALATVGYVAGPGFAVGSASTISPLGGHVGAVPALPLLGALPDSSPGLAWLVLLVPMGAGLVAGWLLMRDRPAGGLLTPACEGLGTGVACGVVGALLVAVAGGPAGGHVMAAVGASPWQVGLCLTGEVGLPAAAVATGLALWRRPVAT